jgi:hypothetical protein
MSYEAASGPLVRPALPLVVEVLADMVQSATCAEAGLFILWNSIVKASQVEKEALVGTVVPVVHRAAGEHPDVVRVAEGVRARQASNAPHCTTSHRTAPRRTALHHVAPHCTTSRTLTHAH